MWEQKADDRALSGGISRLGSKFWKKQQAKSSVLSELERTEGSGTSNGVSYVYRFSSKAWFGSYECRVHRVLLDSASKELQTTDFEVGGYPWQLKLIHEDDGHLAAYLHSRNDTAMMVRYSFTIVNHNKEKENKCWGDVAECPPAGSLGCPQMASAATIKHPHSGFLAGDVFVIRLDMRLKLPENESHSFCADDNSGVYVWKLKDLHGMSPWQLVSEEFVIGKHKWELKFYPNGVKKDRKCTSIYLHSRDNASVWAKPRFTVFNHRPGEPDYSKELISNFTEAGFGCGCPEFLDRRALVDEGLGFVQDGWLTLTVRISIDDQGSQIAIKAKKPPTPTGKEKPKPKRRSSDK